MEDNSIYHVFHHPVYELVNCDFKECKDYGTMLDCYFAYDLCKKYIIHKQAEELRERKKKLEF